MHKRRKLILWRIEKDLKQREVAEALGVTSSHYSNIERGIVDPSYELLMRFRTHYAIVDILGLFEKEEVWSKWQH
jgi:transcriptional regulator with XRE-family HTH domain